MLCWVSFLPPSPPWFSICFPPVLHRFSTGSPPVLHQVFTSSLWVSIGFRSFFHLLLSIIFPLSSRRVFINFPWFVFVLWGFYRGFYRRFYHDFYLGFYQGLYWISGLGEKFEQKRYHHATGLQTNVCISFKVWHLVVYTFVCLHTFVGCAQHVGACTESHVAL